MYLKPFDMICACCKAKKGNVCRSRLTGKKVEPHMLRWNDSLGIRRRGTPSGNERAMTTRGDVT